jgi:hypothetical protein
LEYCGEFTTIRNTIKSLNFFAEYYSFLSRFLRLSVLISDCKEMSRVILFPSFELCASLSIAATTDQPYSRTSDTSGPATGGRRSSARDLAGLSRVTDTAGHNTDMNSAARSQTQRLAVPVGLVSETDSFLSGMVLPVHFRQQEPGLYLGTPVNFS